MLVNISYNEPAKTARIDEAVGQPFSLKERWKLGGIGSSKLIVNASSIEIHNLMVLDQNTNACNVELRPKGIIVRFRSLLETYALIIPYYKLQLYKGKAQEYSIYMDQYFIKVSVITKGDHSFFRKISAQKTLNMPPKIDDL